MLLPPLPLPAPAVRDSETWHWDGKVWSQAKSIATTWQYHIDRRLQAVGDIVQDIKPLHTNAPEPPKLWYSAYPSSDKAWLVIQSPHPWTRELYQELGSPKLYQLDGSKITEPTLAGSVWMLRWQEGREWGLRVREMGGVIVKWDGDNERVLNRLKLWSVALQSQKDPQILDELDRLALQKSLHEQYSMWEEYMQEITEQLLPYLYRPHPSGDWPQRAWRQATSLWQQSLLQLERHSLALSAEEAALPYLKAVWPDLALGPDGKIQ
jgi:hypothetical protein